MNFFFLKCLFIVGKLLSKSFVNIVVTSCFSMTGEQIVAPSSPREGRDGEDAPITYGPPKVW